MARQDTGRPRARSLLIDDPGERRLRAGVRADRDRDDGHPGAGRDGADRRRAARARRPDGHRHADGARGGRGDPRRQRRLRDRPPLRAAGVPRSRARCSSTGTKVLEHGEPFFAKHGPKAVFLGRWVAGLRIASAWLAGMNKMRVADVPVLERARRDRVGGEHRALDLLPRRPRRARDRGRRADQRRGRRRRADRVLGLPAPAQARSSRARPAPAATASRPAAPRRAIAASSARGRGRAELGVVDPHRGQRRASRTPPAASRRTR